MIKTMQYINMHVKMNLVMLRESEKKIIALSYSFMVANKKVRYGKKSNFFMKKSSLCEMLNVKEKTLNNSITRLRKLGLIGSAKNFDLTLNFYTALAEFLNSSATEIKGYSFLHSKTGISNQLTKPTANDCSSNDELKSSIDETERKIDELFSSNDEWELSIDERKFGLDAVKQLFTSSLVSDTNIYKLKKIGNNNFSFNSSSTNSTSSNLQENFGSKYSSEMDWNFKGNNKNSFNTFSGSCSQTAGMEKIKKEIITKWLGGIYGRNE